MGLAARYLEGKGFSTVVLNPTHEFNRIMGVPRTAAIAYPYGRLLGQPGDREGQRKVVLSTLEVLEQAARPGEVRHLPYVWPEEPKDAKWHPPEMSPIINHFIGEIKKARQQEAERAKKGG
ncbi:MAG: hypothetical protein AB1640_16810 [bacterium]